MVARVTVGKKKYANVEARMWELADQADALRKRLTTAVDEDSAAFEQYIVAAKMPKDTPEQQATRAEAMESATLQTIYAPLAVCREAVNVLRLAVEAAMLGNANAISDAASGAALARASLTASGLNVRINCPNLQDQAAAKEFVAEVRRLESEAQALEAELERALMERGNLAG